MMTVVHFDEAMIHLMQFLFGNIPVIKYIFGVLTFKGSVTTLSR